MRKATTWLVAALAGAMAAQGGLKTERFGAPAIAVGKTIYVPGGYSNRGIVGSVERIDAETGKAETLPRAVLARYFHGGASVDGKLVLVGGLAATGGGGCCGGLEYTDAVEEYDPADGTVKRLPPLPTPVARPGVAAMGGKLYVMGGALADGARTALVQVYDCEKGEWSRGADMPKAREGVAIEGNGMIYVPGGYDGTSAVRDFHAYDPANDQWTELPSLPAKLSAHHGAVSKGKLYVFGDYDILDRTAVFDKKTGKWELVDLDYKPVRHHGAAVAGGKIWVIGGNVSASAPFYDYVQSYSQEELETAPRRPWEPGKEKIPAIPGRNGQAGVAASAPKAPLGLLEDFGLVGKSAPALEMPLFGGGAFRLADHAGKVAVLDFWSMNCPPCVRALPEVAELAKEFAGKGVVFAGVNLDPASRREQVGQFLKGRDVPMSTGYGAGNDGRAYEVKGIPCIVVVGKDGLVKGRLVGFGSGTKERLKKAVEALLRDKEEEGFDETLERLLQGEEEAGIPAAVPATAEATAAVVSKKTRSRPAVRVGPAPDPRVFRLKWRRPLAGQYRAQRSFSAVEWRIPPRHWIFAEENGLELYSAADGRLVKTLELPDDAGEKSGKQEAFAFMYLRKGTGGTFIGKRQVHEKTEIGPGSYSYRSVGMGWIGISSEGKVLWERLEEGPQLPNNECHVLPAGTDRDLLAVLTWMGFEIQDEKGNTLAKRDLSATEEKWTFRPAADGGGSEALVIGADVACYEVAVPPAGELSVERFETTWSRSGRGYQSGFAAEGRVGLQLAPRYVAGIEDGQAEVLDAETGQTRARAKMPEEWAKAGGEAMLVYLRDGPSGLVVAARKTKSKIADDSDAAMLSIAGLNEDGTERWRHDFVERQPSLRIAALPERVGRDLLMAQLWDRLVFIDAEGRILLEQPLGITPASWIFRETADGKTFEVVETLDGMAVYRWKQGAVK